MLLLLLLACCVAYLQWNEAALPRVYKQHDAGADLDLGHVLPRYLVQQLIVGHAPYLWSCIGVVVVRVWRRRWG